MKGGNMFFLGYFATDQTIDILNENTICHPPGKKKPLKKGDHVIVRWGTTQHVAEILTFSQEKEYLEGFSYDWFTKELIKPGTKIKKQEEKNIAMKRSLAKGQKNILDAKKKTIAKYNKAMLESLSKEQNLDITSDLIGNKNEGMIGKLNEGKNSAVLIETEEKFALKERKNVESKEFELENNNNSNHLSCKFCPAVQQLISPDVIRVFEYCLVHFKTQLEEKSHDKQMSLFPWEIPAFGKVELMPNSSVWVQSSTLDNLTNLYQKDWTELTRRILKWLVGEQDLGLMTAVGTTNKRGIPPALYSVVKDYVRAHCKIPIKTNGKKSSFNRIVNQMCCRLASKYGLASARNEVQAENHECTGKENAGGTPSSLKRKTIKRTLNSAVIMSSSEESDRSNTVPNKKRKRDSEAAHVNTRKCEPIAHGKKYPVQEEAVKRDINVKISAGPRKRVGPDPSTGKRTMYMTTHSEREGMSNWLKQIIPGDYTEAKKANTSELRVSLATSQSGNFSIESTDLEESKERNMTTSSPYDSSQQRMGIHLNDSKYIIGRRSSNSSVLNETRSPINNESAMPKNDHVIANNPANFNEMTVDKLNLQSTPIPDGRSVNLGEAITVNDRENQQYSESVLSAGGPTQYPGPQQQHWNFPTPSTYPEAVHQPPYQGSYAAPYYHQYNNYPPGYYGPMNQPANSEIPDPGIYNPSYTYHSL